MADDANVNIEYTLLEKEAKRLGERRSFAVQDSSGSRYHISELVVPDNNLSIRVVENIRDDDQDKHLAEGTKHPLGVHGFLHDHRKYKYTKKDRIEFQTFAQSVSQDNSLALDPRTYFQMIKSNLALQFSQEGCHLRAIPSADSDTGWNLEGGLQILTVNQNSYHNCHDDLASTLWGGGIFTGLMGLLGAMSVEFFIRTYISHNEGNLMVPVLGTIGGVIVGVASGAIYYAKSSNSDKLIGSAYYTDNFEQSYEIWNDLGQEDIVETAPGIDNSGQSNEINKFQKLTTKFRKLLYCTPHLKGATLTVSGEDKEEVFQDLERRAKLYLGTKAA